MLAENYNARTLRIRSELRLLGFEVAERIVAKYRIKSAKPPSQTWKTFLANPAKQIVAYVIPIARVCRYIRLLWCKAAASHYTRPDVNDGAIGLRNYDNKLFIAEYGEEEI